MSVLQIAAVSVQSGKAKATGNDYQMNRAVVMIPQVPRETPTFKLQVQGLRAIEVAVADHVIDPLFVAFREKFKGMPVAIDVETSFDGDGKMMIVGLSRAAA